MDQGDQDLVDPRLCGIEKGDGTACMKVKASGQDYCKYHAKIVRQREEKREGQRVWVLVMETLWGQENPLLALTLLETAITTDRITTPLGTMYLHRLQQELEIYERLIEERLAPAPRGELEALARDRQNVHTSAVAQQTRSGMDLLLETPVSSDQDTLCEIETVWEQTHTRSIRMVLADMRQWYNVQTCRTEDDWLYRRTLDGLWAYIQTSPVKEALTERLWEECYESVRMCCDGHLSRLCNVLCGFQEEFKPPVSIGELLQQKISAIAERDIPVEDKVGEAWTVFEELAIPMDQREAWIDAF